jgi:hypothetical protein
VEIQEHVRAELDKSKITKLVGNQYTYNTIQDLENAYRKSSLAPVDAKGDD